MLTLIRKDLRLQRLPLLVAVMLIIAPYVGATAMLYQVYAPDMPKAATIADYLATAAVFGLMMSTVTAGMLAGNIFACERADGSSVFLFSQPVSRRQILTSKATLVFAVLGAVWLVHGLVLSGLAPSLDSAAKPYVRINNPVIFASALVVLTTGIAWLTSIVGRSPSLAISAGLAAAFFVPWSIYLTSLFLAMAPDDIQFVSAFTQWIVGLGGFTAGTLVYLTRVEP